MLISMRDREREREVECLGKTQQIDLYSEEEKNNLHFKKLNNIFFIIFFLF